MRNSTHVWSSPGAPSETSSRRPAPSASPSPYVPYSSPSPRGSLSAFCCPGQEGAASTTKWSVTGQDKPLVSVRPGTDGGRRGRDPGREREAPRRSAQPRCGCGLGQTPDGATEGAGATREAGQKLGWGGAKRDQVLRSEYFLLVRTLSGGRACLR